MRLYLLTVEDPLYTHLILEPLLASGVVQLAGVTILHPTVGWRRLGASLLTLGPFRVFRAALAQVAPRALTTSVAMVLARHGVETRLVVNVADVNAPSHVEWLRASGAPLMLALNSPQIISPSVLGLFDRGVLNVHFGMLPRYRGIMPAYQALMRGDRSFGVTVHLMDAKVDNGPILAQRRLPILDLDTLPDLYAKGFVAAGEMVVSVVRCMAAGTSQSQENDGAQATYYGEPTWRSLSRYAALALRRRIAR